MILGFGSNIGLQLLDSSHWTPVTGPPVTGNQHHTVFHSASATIAMLLSNALCFAVCDRQCLSYNALHITCYHYHRQRVDGSPTHAHSCGELIDAARYVAPRACSAHVRNGLRAPGSDLSPAPIPSSTVSTTAVEGDLFLRLALTVSPSS